MANITLEDSPVIRISHDEMEALLRLPARKADQPYTKEEVMAAIDKAGVHYGLDEAMVDRMISEHIYGREMRIAKGDPMENGIDGEYKYYFSCKLNNKPSMRIDGSVDYWSIHAVETVEEGDIIADYTPPKAGKNGMTVKAKALMAKPGKPQLPLVGRGFEVENFPDGRARYTASMDGKIDMNANRVTISSVYEVYGDVDLKTGNIDFHGDVLIHGNVTANAKIKATGSVTIDGTAEQCTIDAGKDIILRGGLLGGQKAVLKSKGNIVAKFFEYAKVEAQGFIEADSALDSDLISYDKIFMNGKHATIVGGSVYGVKGVEANSIGNINEIKTTVYAGLHNDIAVKMFNLDTIIHETQAMIDKINTGIAQFDELAREKGLDLRNDERRVSLMRARIVKQAELSADKEESERLHMIADNAQGATIRIIQEVFAGVTVMIDGAKKALTEEQESVEYFNKNGNIVMYSIKDELA